MLDTLRYYETPEGIDLELKLAGLMPRAMAWLIDVIVQALLQSVLAGLLMLSGGGVGQGLMLMSVFLISWFYPVFFEVLNQGATPGKKYLRLKVVHDNGTPVGWSASLIRNLLRTVDFMPLLYGVGVAAILINKDFKRLGDMVAGTLVIYNDAHQTRHEIPDATAKPPPIALTLTEQRAILHFAERSKQLSVERQQELADSLSVLTGKQGGEGVTRLLQYANWLHKG